jgi:hypothetical protein
MARICARFRGRFRLRISEARAREPRRRASSACDRPVQDLDRISRCDWKDPLFVGRDQREENLEPVTVRGPDGGLLGKIAIDFRKRPTVIVGRANWPDIPNRIRLSNGFRLDLHHPISTVSGSTASYSACVPTNFIWHALYV